ncbi:4'-phosphopantetheinyl transferase superfamily protein [Puniceicoccales bacterium CK1056]|uniref:Enterobactin synthase component D n=1 Tax=Oceanipulchritudo coccoides TaxID=2706888 RepID=A0A6B2LYH3_9BACT|nr:4'-phosphopantetheinyl transferase superfamily protein [Oceanipulchritudo coccoides]NDV61638.1 4'-phosphopantetheinyl transferase superfamily protein [Oceanipulchritudo coccoides]
MRTTDQALLQGLFPPEISTSCSEPGIFRDQVFPEEWALVESAVAKRQAEFCGGRVSAHLALEKLGIAKTPILSNPDRSPCWPAGVVGTISHTKGFCGAAVCQRGEIIGLGLDIELAEPLDEKLIRRICTAGEQGWLSGYPVGQAGLFAKLVFCIKEAAYKCQYPITRQFIEFHQAEVRLDPGAKTYEIVFTGLKSGTPQYCAQIGGKYDMTDTHVFASAVIRRESPE